MQDSSKSRLIQSGFGGVVDVSRIVQEAHYVKTWSNRTFINLRNAQFIDKNNLRIINVKLLYPKIRAAYPTSGRVFAKRSRYGAPLLRCLYVRKK